MESSTALNLRKEINDRRIINGHLDGAMQLHPIKYQFAEDFRQTMYKNTWFPKEITMQKDVAQLRSGMVSADDKHALEFALGFFSTADNIVANNLALSVYRHITAPEIRLAVLKQAEQETVHVDSYQYCIESLGLDADRVFAIHRTAPSIVAKNAFATSLCKQLHDPNFQTGTIENDRIFVENLFDFYIIMEGVDFYTTFANILSFKPRGMFPGTAQQFEYIIRDESGHFSFGVDLINAIRIEMPHIFTPDFEQKLSNKLATAGQLEADYGREMLPRGILGFNASTFNDYTQYVCNRRASQVRIPMPFPPVKNPFPWMNEIIDLTKNKNFFETTVIEYAVGGALEEDDDGSLF